MARIGPCVVVVSIACGEGGNGGGAVVRRDSAGVSIVESAEAQWSAEEAWTVDSVPTLSIGEMEGDQGYLFGSVAGAVRLEDGSIAVGDGQAIVVLNDRSRRPSHMEGKTAFVMRVLRVCGVVRDVSPGVAMRGLEP